MRCKRLCRLLQLAVFGLLWAFTAHAQWQSIGDLSSHFSERNGVTLKAGQSVVRVFVLPPDLTRIRVARNGIFLPDQSSAVVKNDRGNVGVEVQPSADAGSGVELPYVVRGDIGKSSRGWSYDSSIL